MKKTIIHKKEYGCEVKIEETRYGDDILFRIGDGTFIGHQITPKLAKLLVSVLKEYIER